MSDTRIRTKIVREKVQKRIGVYMLRAGRHFLRHNAVMDEITYCYLPKGKGEA